MTGFTKPLFCAVFVGLSLPLFAMGCAGPEHNHGSGSDVEPNSLDASPHAAETGPTVAPDQEPVSAAGEITPVTEARAAQDMAPAPAEPSPSGARSAMTAARADPEAVKRAVQDQLRDLDGVLADPEAETGSFFDDMGPSPQVQDLLDRPGRAEVPADGDPGSLQAP
jgi:hypothetical protein